jgi:hypothetical protein
VAAREAAKNGAGFKPATTATADDRPKKEVSGMDDYDDEEKKEKKWCCTIM